MNIEIDKCHLLRPLWPSEKLDLQCRQPLPTSKWIWHKYS